MSSYAPEIGNSVRMTSHAKVDGTTSMGTYQKLEVSERISPTSGIGGFSTNNPISQCNMDGSLRTGGGNNRNTECNKESTGNVKKPLKMFIPHSKSETSLSSGTTPNGLPELEPNQAYVTSVLFTLRWRLMSQILLALPVVGIFICLITSVIFHADHINNTICKVRDYHYAARGRL